MTTTERQQITQPVEGLMEKIVNFFKRHPEQLHMEYWGERKGETPCGTTACLAGEALILTDNAQWMPRGKRYMYDGAGKPILDEDGTHRWYTAYELGVVDPARDYPDEPAPWHAESSSMAIMRRAQLLLGLTYDQADRLFHANTEEIGAMVQAMTGIEWDTSGVVAEREAREHDGSYDMGYSPLTSDYEDEDEDEFDDVE